MISDRNVVLYVIDCIKEKTEEFFIKLKACYLQLVFRKKLLSYYVFMLKIISFLNDFISNTPR